MVQHQLLQEEESLHIYSTTVPIGSRVTANSTTTAPTRGRVNSHSTTIAPIGGGVTSNSTTTPPTGGGVTSNSTTTVPTGAGVTSHSTTIAPIEGGVTSHTTTAPTGGGGVTSNDTVSNNTSTQTTVYEPTRTTINITGSAPTSNIDIMKHVNISESLSTFTPTNGSNSSDDVMLPSRSVTSCNSSRLVFDEQGHNCTENFSTSIKEAREEMSVSTVNSVHIEGQEVGS